MSFFAVPWSRREAEPGRLSIMMVGLRGFPNIQGGVERHVEQLAPLIAAKDYDVEVLVRSCYVPASAERSWQGVRITRLWCWKSRSLETLSHTLLGVLTAAWRRPDILHVQAIGPALFVPLARLLGLRVVVTHHGPDYDRDKWGRGAKLLLRLGESLGMRFANGRIAISNPIAQTIHAKYGVDAMVIPNGVKIPPPSSTRAALDRFELTPGCYVLTVSRIVPEKRHLDLINAFERSALNGWKLVIVGAADHPNDYSRLVEATAKATPGVVLAGFQTGTALEELFAYAGVFVLPSSHEGLPIALLEALAAGCRCLASDIPSNREVGLPGRSYFPVGDVDALGRLLKDASLQPDSDAERAERRTYVKNHFNWESVAQRTTEVYRSVFRNSKRGTGRATSADQPGAMRREQRSKSHL